VSIILFVLSMIGENFRVQIIQSNGLPEVLYPYSILSFYLTSAAIGLFLFGIVLLVSTGTQGEDNIRSKLSGSGLVAAGLVMIGFAVFLSLVNYSDEQVRCFTIPSVCPASTIQYYNDIYIGSTIGAILGAVVLLTGIKLLRRFRNLDQISEIPIA
jgi:hypothetical protein